MPGFKLQQYLSTKAYTLIQPTTILHESYRIYKRVADTFCS